jgi:uncharacterized protein
VIAPSTAVGVTAPAPASERIALLDILRGLALFGMILVHFHQDMRLPATGLEDLVGWGVYVLVEQKAWGTFAFLFGVGFAVLLRRLDARGIVVAPIYLRRLAALAVFGIVAEVGFGFHILFDYAFWGVALLLIRRWSTRALLATAAVAACLMWVAIEGMALYAWWTGTGPAGLGFGVRPVDVRAQQSYAIVLAMRWDLFVRGLPTNWREFMPDMNLALFILGLLALRHGVLEEPKRHVRLIVGWMVFGAGSWAASWLVTWLVEPRMPKFPVPYMGVPLFQAFGLVQDQWLCLTYVGAVTLLLAYRQQWIARLAIFGQAGRMALTNYMLQVMVLDVLASVYGFGLKLRPYVYVVAAVALFSIEAAFSRVWLARYRFGPLEWLWRSVTYMRWQPLRREAPGSPAVPASPGLGSFGRESRVSDPES